MAKIELAKSKDGREIILRIKDPSSFPAQPQVRIRWYAENKSLGPKGWQNVSYDIPPNSYHKDLLIGLDSRITNYIQSGTPIEISIAELELKEELLWSSRFPGTERGEPRAADPAESFDKVDRALLEQAEAEIVRSRQKLSDCEAGAEALRGQLQTVRSELEQEKGRPPTTKPSPPEPRPSGWWRIAAAALLLGIGVGAAGMYAFARAEAGRPSAGEGRSVAQLEVDLSQLKTEAFAPLAGDLMQAADRSPKGDVPDQVAAQGLPADKVGVLEDRARTFLNHGLEMARNHDTTEAVYWYKQALSLCPADAMLYLGDAYLNGDGAHRDARTGFQLMRISSSLGTRRATDLVRQILQRQQIPLAPSDFANLYQRSR
jgi:hypothetical protein